MKKQYFRPQISIVTISPTQLLTVSGQGVYGKLDKTTAGQIEIEYGGVDEDGELDPE